jgi:hypothetical protein
MKKVNAATVVLLLVALASFAAAAKGHGPAGSLFGFFSGG